jgi:hypothetical protein
MSGPQPASSAFHRAADVARRLRCSEWWVKEQARRRRIPYCRIGGSYRFTDEHVAEIARIFEVRPDDTPAKSVPRQPVPPLIAETGSVVRLTARRPRRSRGASQDAAA